MLDLASAILNQAPFAAPGVDGVAQHQTTVTVPHASTTNRVNIEDVHLFKTTLHLGRNTTTSFGHVAPA